jgi:hypothetical protein
VNSILQLPWISAVSGTVLVCHTCGTFAVFNLGYFLGSGGNV